MSKIIIEIDNESNIKVHYESDSNLYLIATIGDDGIFINNHCNKLMLDLVIHIIYQLGNTLNVRHKYVSI